MREWILAAFLVVAACCVVIGVAQFSTGAAWVAAGLSFAGFGWLVFGDVP